MPWLKKNLWLVGGGAVALALLLIAGGYLYRNWAEESRVSSSLNEQTQELNDLNNLNPHPGNERINNIEEAKRQEKELEAYLNEAQKQFVPLSYPTNLDSGQFKLLLDTTIYDLQRRAEKASVKLQPQCAFAFSAQKPLLSFDQGSIAPMTRMLIDIKSICEMLFDAKVLTLDGIRRPSVTAQDTPSQQPGMSEYWTRKPATNDLAVVTPYEFTYHCFTGELAAVLEGLYSSPHCFIVKNLVVDPSPSQLLDQSSTASPDYAPTMPSMPYSMNYRYFQQMMRYGIPRGYGPVMPPPETPTPSTRGGLTTVLDEKPVRVIMWVDVVLIRDLNEVRAARTSRARAPRPPPTPDDGSTPQGDSSAPPAEPPAAN